MRDVEAIEQVVVKERQYRVRHADRELAGCYWEDATVTTSWQTGPVSTFVGRQPAEMGDGLPIVGRSSTPLVHLRTATRAYVELPTICDYWEIVNGTEAVLESFMRLIYRVERRGGVWTIANMLSMYESDKLAPAVPGTDLRIDPADLEGLRHPYRFLAYTRLAAGGQIGQDLLGIDRPDDIARVYADAEAWCADS
ncbi:hypothetical protein GCM10025864_34900 [Luteimicrobium album]|uniref:SnoaL-like domain-containing protein n=1 Tax=Luteimicrobium album TaxID=1054550 RepID=A0ABQ6I4Z3_9MICO|nr:hypothetical protein [Luteimicrobium album]GMA25731.1 hypothetical protein GCM10025864_34900 [Luteimicrobium album]